MRCKRHTMRDLPRNGEGFFMPGGIHNGKPVYIMQKLLKIFFHPIKLLKISSIALSDKLFQKPSVKRAVRYPKINFFHNTCILSKEL